jgi:dTDP-4-amino-4,6-dideoxygalactose transaminase
MVWNIESMRMEKAFFVDNFLPFSQPTIEDGEISEVIDALRSGWITTGPKVKLFEKEFAKYIGCKHAIAVNSCTAALHLALDAIGIKEGDEVITSPMTFGATAEVIRYFKAKPIFVDIDDETMNIDVGILEDIVEKKCKKPGKKKLKVIIPVHYGGYPCEMDVIIRLAMKYNLKIIEDAAHAFPCFYHEKMVGTIGDITCFSFYSTKTITTGEGGMATTENQEWAEKMRIMSLHGISKDAWKRYTAEGSWYYEIIAPGYKYNLTDIAAALGLAQLKKTDIFWKRRIEIATKYNEYFKDLIEIETPLMGNNGQQDKWRSSKDVKHSWHLYVIKLNLQSLTIDRNGFIEELKKRGIGTSVHFIPLHIHPYYRDLYGYKPEDFPVAYNNYKRIISLPIYPKMTDGDIERVTGAVLDVISNNRK